MSAQPQSILPDILATAAEYGLDFRPVPGRPDERRANCPFCEKGDKRRHLYINAAKQVFNCYKCGRNGGVLTFLALIKGRSEMAVLEDLREKILVKRSYRHPAETLSAYQLQAMGFIGGRPDWPKEWQERPEYAKNLADWIWQEWRTFLMGEKYQAAYHLLVACELNDYEAEVAQVKKRGQEIGYPHLLEEVETGTKAGRLWAKKAERMGKLMAGALKEADAKYQAVKTLYKGLTEGNYSAAIVAVQKQQEEMGYDNLLSDVLSVISRPDPPEWVLNARDEVKAQAEKKLEKVG